MTSHPPRRSRGARAARRRARRRGCRCPTAARRAPGRPRPAAARCRCRRRARRSGPRGSAPRRARRRARSAIPPPSHAPTCLSPRPSRPGGDHRPARLRRAGRCAGARARRCRPATGRTARPRGRARRARPARCAASKPSRNASSASRTSRPTGPGGAATPPAGSAPGRPNASSTRAARGPISDANARGAVGRAVGDAVAGDDGGAQHGAPARQRVGRSDEDGVVGGDPAAPLSAARAARPAPGAGAPSTRARAWSTHGARAGDVDAREVAAVDEACRLAAHGHLGGDGAVVRDDAHAVALPDDRAVGGRGTGQGELDRHARRLGVAGRGRASRREGIPCPGGRGAGLPSRCASGRALPLARAAAPASSPRRRD